MLDFLLLKALLDVDEPLTQSPESVENPLEVLVTLGRLLLAVLPAALPTRVRLPASGREDALRFSIGLWTSTDAWMLEFTSVQAWSTLSESAHLDAPEPRRILACIAVEPFDRCKLTDIGMLLGEPSQRYQRIH
jgi:hypothetical protein